MARSVLLELPELLFEESDEDPPPPSDGIVAFAAVSVANRGPGDDARPFWMV